LPTNLVNLFTVYSFWDIHRAVIMPTGWLACALPPREEVAGPRLPTAAYMQPRHWPPRARSPTRDLPCGHTQPNDPLKSDRTPCGSSAAVTLSSRLLVPLPCV
jgi:hypothetical protein